MFKFYLLLEKQTKLTQMPKLKKVKWFRQIMIRMWRR